MESTTRLCREPPFTRGPKGFPLLLNDIAKILRGFSKILVVSRFDLMYNEQRQSC